MFTKSEGSILWDETGKEAGVQLTNTGVIPYDGYFGNEADTFNYLEKLLTDHSSGVELPAAIIVETIQGQGGIKVAKDEWLKKVQKLCQRLNIMFIIDDIQAGCGRAGSFFSFESIDLDPDFICLSKSISGYGLPLALTLFKPEHDIWGPAEHTGTFRGNTLAFVTAIKSFEFWEDPSFEQSIHQKGEKTRSFLSGVAKKYPSLELEVRGRGLMNGVASSIEGFGENVCKEAFKRGLIMDKCGPNKEVPKLFPPINIDDVLLDKGLEIVEESIAACVTNYKTS
jgi:diaminobutyrate-2-oxoglutarate transaminase